MSISYLMLYGESAFGIDVSATNIFTERCDRFIFSILDYKNKPTLSQMQTDARLFCSSQPGFFLFQKAGYEANCIVLIRLNTKQSPAVTYRSYSEAMKYISSAWRRGEFLAIYDPQFFIFTQKFDFKMPFEKTEIIVSDCKKIKFVVTRNAVCKNTQEDRISEKLRRFEQSTS
jgi:hypothetical protein